MSDRDRRDRLTEIGADAQRRNGMIPETRAIEQTWARVLEESDRRKADETPKPADRGLEHDPRTAREAIEQNGGKVLSKEEILAARGPKRGKQKPIAKRAAARMRMLKMFPDWNQKLIDAFDRGARLAFTAGPSAPMSFEGQMVSPMRLAIWVEIRKVLDESSRVFGDWERLPRKQKQHFSGA